MFMEPGNFLYLLKIIVPGLNKAGYSRDGGFKHDVPFPLSGVIGANGATLVGLVDNTGGTADTGGTVTTVSSVATASNAIATIIQSINSRGNFVTVGSFGFALQVTAGQTTAGRWTWEVPRDYDSQTDRIHFRAIAYQKAQVTDKADGIKCYAQRFPIGGTAFAAQVTAAATPVNGTTAAPVVTLSSQVFDFEFSNLLNTGVVPVSNNVGLPVSGLQPGDVIAFELVTNGNVTAGDEILILAVYPSYDSTIVSWYDGVDTFGKSLR